MTCENLFKLDQELEQRLGHINHPYRQEYLKQLRLEEVPKYLKKKYSMDDSDISFIRVLVRNESSRDCGG